MPEPNPDVQRLRGYRVRYEGPTRRVGKDGLWGKLMEFWDDDGKLMGAWRWVKWEDWMWSRSGGVS